MSGVTFAKVALMVPVMAVAVALAMQAPVAESHPTRWVWSYSTLIQRIDGARVTLSGRRVLVNRELVICNGEGRTRRFRGARGWSHFTCTQTLFRNGLDRDVTFRVHVRGRSLFAITNARYGPD